MTTQDLVFDYDDIGEWGPRLREALTEYLPKEIVHLISRARPEYTSDAYVAMLNHVAKKETPLIEATASWLKGQSIAAYHGSRLTETEILSVLKHGLKRLVARNRYDRLEAILSRHPDWPKAEFQLMPMLDRYGKDSLSFGYGLREGQVHATISKSGLSRSFNHYLTHGSEFDQNVVQAVLGDDGIKLLETYGEPLIFTLHIPGEEAFAAGNPYWPNLPRDIPNIVRETLYAFAFWLAYPDFQTSTLETDCGLIFSVDIPAAYIVSKESWA